MKKEAAYLNIRELSKSFKLHTSLFSHFSNQGQKELVNAVNTVSFSVARGQTFGLVGESGCGKSTLGRMIVGLMQPDNGTISIDGRKIFSKGRTAPPPAGKLQMVFQDPFSSLNPRWKILDIVAEPIRHKARSDKQNLSTEEVSTRVYDLLEEVGLTVEDAQRYPHTFSGGQKQRIAIARALASTPELIVCDEPTSSLDVSIQAQILNLLRRIQRERSLTLVFISHDLAVISHMADYVGVMNQGHMLEIAPAKNLFSTPAHPYTRMLLNLLSPPTSTSTDDTQDVADAGNDEPSDVGCCFRSRCDFALDICAQSSPELKPHAHGSVACWGIEEGRIPDWNNALASK